MTIYPAYGAGIQLARRFSLHGITGQLQAWLTARRAARVKRNATGCPNSADGHFENERSFRPLISYHPAVVSVSILAFPASRSGSR